MNKGWVKLYRKAIENPVWKHDLNAWHVFEWLLMVVDKKTGSYTVGRMQGAKATGLKASTFRNALNRLEKYDMVRTGKRTGIFTFVHITNFAQYQGIIEVSKSELSTGYPQSKDRLEDTKQEEHRKELLKDFSIEIAEMKKHIFEKHLVN